jgi:hypothetical protein
MLGILLLDCDADQYEPLRFDVKRIPVIGQGLCAIVGTAIRMKCEQCPGRKR